MQETERTGWRSHHHLNDRHACRQCTEMAAAEDPLLAMQYLGKTTNQQNGPPDPMIRQPTVECPVAMASGKRAAYLI
jgi:hypothetical protein